MKKRTTTGCLTCRKRKKKCDEVKPICTACERNFLECEWPDYSDGRIRKRKKPPCSNGIQFNNTNVKLKRKVRYHATDLNMEIYVKKKSNRLYAYEDSKLKRISSFPIEILPEAKTEPSEFIEYNAEKMFDTQYWEEAPPLDLELGDLPFIDLPEGFEVPSFEVQMPPLDQEVRYKDIMERYKSNELLHDSLFKDLNMESFIFYSCVQGYIPKLGTQLTSPDLTVGATFVPFVNDNPIMKQVFLCCGATYLAWKDLERFQEYSEEYYENCKKLLKEYMVSNPTFYQEDWLFASMQLLCNRVKNAFSGTVDESVSFLVNSFKIISHRYFDNHAIRPHERMFVESFIYHYSISILYARDISSLPSPFKIFKELNKALKCPVYNCDNIVGWMKNPLLGSCLDVFEIIAKISFIARFTMPLSKDWLMIAVKLRNICFQYKHPVAEQPMTEVEWFNFRVNSMVGLLTAKSCYLFASKIIDYETFDVHSPHVKEFLKEIIGHYKEIPERHQVWGILPWAMLISGAFCTNPDDQDFILQRINQMAERAHSYAGIKMAHFLHEIWNDSNNLNYLFDRTRLSMVDM